MLIAKKDSDDQVLFVEDQAWMEMSSDSEEELNVNMVLMAKMEKILFDVEESSLSDKDTLAKLVCWSSKKQNYVSISIAKAEYVVVSGCFAQMM
uniref:Uncharacterized protein n=1 Tax=Tanacetum cinerariifolium TaxID=118510 RepID=A0A699ILD3_TANCI|nr:hypothetical protein [Tanacetum cinerariifolium]